MSISITKQDDTALSAMTLTAERGVDSDHIAIRIRNTGVSTIYGAFVTMYAEKTAGMGDYDTSGHPAVDERQGRFQVTGIDSAPTPGQQVAYLGVQTLGYLAQAVLPPILPGDAIDADVWISQPSTSAGGGAVNIKLEVANDSTARAVGPGVTDVGRGILSGVNTPTSFLISGRELTASGTPDDKVHVAAGAWLYQGVADSSGSAANVTLNQNDGASAALATGEAYIAAISQGLSATPTTTKGLKGTTPDFPVVPLGEVLLGFVQVNYHSGSSVIQGTDISDDLLTYGRYLVVPAASGLTAAVHAGRALLADFMTRRDVQGDVNLTASATNRIWLEATGQLTVTTTAAQPSPGALLLATATTNTTDVTGSTDERVYVGQSGTLSPHAATHAYPGGTDPLDPATLGAATTAQLALKADLASPVFSGTPTAPTASPGDDSLIIATTAFVQDAVSSALRWKDPILFSGDGSSQPSVISDKPTSDNLFVFVNGLLQVHDPLDGGAQDYNYNPSTGQITHTPVLAVGKTAHYRYIA